MKEAHEHAIVKMLDEELGRREPPDLADRILATIERRDAPTTDAVTSRSTEPIATGRRRSALSGVLVGAATAAALTAALALWAHNGSTGAPAEIRGAVTRGTLTWHATDRIWRVTTPEPYSVGPAVGDRLRSGMQQLRLTIEGLGTLECDPATELEVMEMVWKDFGGGFAVGALTVGVVAGAVTWYGGGEPVAAVTGDRLELSRSDGQTTTANSDRSQDTTDATLVDARRRIAELEQRLARRPAEGAPVESPPEPVSVDPMFVATDYDAVLAEVDWDIAGNAALRFLAASQQVAEILAAGEDIPLQLTAEAESTDMALVAEIAKVLESGLPGMTPTGKIHHPTVGGNLLNAALAKAGLGFDVEQRKTATDLMRRYSDEDATRRDAYDESTMDLERFVDEAEMHERYYEDVRGILTAKQATMLSYGAAGDRVGIDPFGAAFEWSKWDQHVVVPDRPALATEAAEGWARELDLDVGQRELLQPIVENWVRDLPGEWLDRGADHLDLIGRPHIGRVRSAALRQVELMREIARGLDLSPAQRQALRSVRRIYVPYLGG